MGYMAGESPQGAEGRRAEADRILRIVNGLDQFMEPHEQLFLTQIQDGPVSIKQLYWLRDIKEKYL